MIRNYFKIAFRNLWRNRLIASINIGGLAAGLTICFLIGLWSYNELKFDAFHEKGDRVLLFQQNENNSGSGSGFAALIEKEISQVQQTARLVPARALLSYKDEVYNEKNFYFADSEIFDLLTLPLKIGDAKKTLNTPYGLLISEKAALTYFQDEDPIGKIVSYENKQDLVVTGILKNLPYNSHIEIDFLISISHAEELLGEKLNGYWDNRSLTYLLLSKGSSAKSVFQQLPAVKAKTKDQNSGVWKLNVIPLRDIHLQHTLDSRVKAQGEMEKVNLFTFIAFLVLVLACFNYINLATARASLKAKEVGIRKTIGASRKDLFFQFLFDSFINIIIAAIAATLLTILLLPYFNNLSGRVLTMSTILDPEILLIIFSGLMILGLLVGSYPSLVLSAYKPVDILKNKINNTDTGLNFRKILVVGQFVISVIMIVATLIVLQQFNYMQNKNLGYVKERILNISFPGKTEADKRLLLKQKLQTLSGIEEVSLISSIPGGGSWYNKLVVDYLPAGMKDAGIQQIFVDEDFLKTFNIDLAWGRDFRAGEHKPGPVYMINEAAQQKLQWAKMEGRQIGYYNYEYSPEGGYKEVAKRGRVVGVVKNYHQGNLKTFIEPLLIVLNPEVGGQMALKLRPGNLKNTLADISELWVGIFPDKPFEYTFMDDDFNQTYKEEIRSGKIISIFAGLAILISCMGLFGLAAFTMKQRTKEIGIRKILGASVSNIVSLLSKDFIKLVVFANILAWPIAWYAMNKWLEDFVYRIDITWWIFVVAGSLVLFLTILTVTIQAAKAALSNPVKSLRTE